MSLGAFLLLVPLVTAAAHAAGSGDFAGLVDIGGGRKMYLECRGTGSPTVVLVGGLRASAEDWSIGDKSAPPVFPEVAKFTRVCAYDRPGTPVGDEPSRSDLVPQPTTAGDAVADLHAMLRAAGEAGPYVLVGHSERRSIFGESDAVVAAKFEAAVKAGLTPILCVGETLQEREAGVTEKVVSRQLDAVISNTGVAALAQAVVAYEPVWAIGTGRTATPEQAQAVHAYIRGAVGVHDAPVAGGLRILYGGSVKAANAAQLFAMRDIDGGLIGGASLVADEFMAICRAAARGQ